GAPYRAAAMIPTGNPYEFGASIPSQPAAIVRYWFSASDTRGGSNTDPPAAPARGVYTFLAGPVATVFFQNMESDPGWVAGAPGDDAVTGVWVRANPNGTLVDGQQCAPEDDHTPGSKTVCWVTGNGGPAEDPALND